MSTKKDCKKDCRNLFLAIILIIFCVLIAFDITYRKNVYQEYSGAIYAVEGDNFVHTDPKPFSFKGTVSYNIRTGVRLQGELTSPSLELGCYFITPTSELVDNYAWYRALLSSGPPAPGPVLICETSCNEIFFSKKLDALIFPMEQNKRQSFLILAEDKKAIENSLTIIAEISNSSSLES